MMKPVHLNYSLYLVTDQDISLGRSLQDVVAAALRGGVTLVQYREKHAGMRQSFQEAFELRELCHSFHVPLIINDRVDLALAVDADGVHVGQSDMPAAVARRLIGPNKILGVSVEAYSQLEGAITDGADYIGVGPIFSTATKPDAAAPLGLDGLKRIAAEATIPVVAIGGINAANTPSLIQTGIAGVAVVSAIVSAPDVYQATRQLCELIGEARRAGKEIA